MSETSEHRQFVQLHRTFRELSQDSSDENLDFAATRLFSEQMTWNDVITRFRVVILSEAGSGKTAEIRNIADTLRNEGKRAFFLRLEHIPQDLEEAFETGSWEEFQEWLNSEEEGWLLLDSVDEARLRHPGDFERAIRRLGRRISRAHQRAHIVITSRTTAWRPRTDLDHCTKHFPYDSSIAVVPSTTDELDGPSQDFDADDSKAANKQDGFLILALDNLNAEQIETFVAAKGVQDTKALLDAVERVDAWAFTTRPQDLAELAEFWSDCGRIGSRLELIQHSIDRRLSERDQGRAEARRLTMNRARLGAMLLAAAATISRVPTICVPDGSENSDGIPISKVLPDWDDKDIATLLERPIFDDAIYGTVRFHHRSVREFLTAAWMLELLDRATSRNKIEALLFRNQYGVDVVIPTMRPVIPWLAIKDEKICERVNDIAPEVLLEGGDPNKLPLSFRSRLLKKVCMRIVDGASNHGATGNEAIQRFANQDLVPDIKKLIKEYRSSDELLFFLLRMVWIGELREVLPEAKAVALDADSSKYTRIAAFRAVKAIGTTEDVNEIRQKFLSEESILNRDWLEELIDQLEPNAESTQWLLGCLAKADEPNLNRSDGLLDAVVSYILRVPPEVLPMWVKELNRLLTTPPSLERDRGGVSQRFGWLMRAAGHAAERLIEERFPEALEDANLSILHKLTLVNRSNFGDYSDASFRIAELVPMWPELNRALFWHDVHQSQNPTKDTPTEFWQVSIPGGYWQFDESDFEFAVKGITDSLSPTDKRIALSLAFRLYVDGGRDRRQRNRLKKIVAGDKVLEGSLRNYLRPPARGRSKWQVMDARFKRQAKARQAKEAKRREDWREFLKENTALLRGNGIAPGEFSNCQYHLHEELRDKNNQSSHLGNGNWRCLIGEFGDDVAQAFRDGVTGFWRKFVPKLRSEGAPANKISFPVIFGLTGLLIEAQETDNWPADLTPQDAELACRYASYEINGFPTWLPRLFDAFPTVVQNFMINEIRYESATTKSGQNSHYILSDINWHGEWAWDQLGPDVFSILKAKEPANLDNLVGLLSIVQNSSVSDGDIAKLAARKSKTLKRQQHAACWFAVWVGVAPEKAIPALEDRIERILAPEARTDFAMEFVTRLMGSRRGELSRVRGAYRFPVFLKQLYLLMHQYIQANDDINRIGKGAYSPGLRDLAQDARNGLAEILRTIPGKDAFIALNEIASAHPTSKYRPWFSSLAKAKAESDADLCTWTPAQVRDFYDNLECSPENHRQLAELVHLRLLDLKTDLEDGDASIAKILQEVNLETDMRVFIGRELREKSFGRYAIPQEEELADAKRPDLRVHGITFDAPVPCELKLSDKWSGPVLFERLENQLCGDYLRDPRSNRGVFILVHQGKRKSWKIPGSRKRMNFDGLVSSLRQFWQEIALNYPDIENVNVIGIDLTKRFT
ncbi:hypothetical protein LOC68_08585 [Blastopirellula sp. JC732]|uniref:Uncharacterized protein n=1 Tax=Blastopirellula sediminis TaxID=2894196 RepID=A0A9X1SF00_9BACT|nr:hypothetical protein [Blastopirellula sediminis]MCC9608773.1 hypothetical protein [Blastopirellula sediminis]MCC9628450.1 hypothetical protein [Blastopirellula sediminis]